MNELYPMNSVIIIWPSDNTFNAAPLPAEFVARVLSKLRAVGISAHHQAESVELVDIITDAPTGYTHHHERFTVNAGEERMAREIIESNLPISLSRLL